MSDVLQFKDIVGRSTAPGALQPLQRKGDTLADPLIQPIQAPIQRMPDPGRAEARSEPKTAEAKATEDRSESPIQAKAEPAQLAPVEAPVVEAAPGKISEAASETAAAKTKEPAVPAATTATLNPIVMKAAPAPAPEAVEAEPEAVVEEKVKAPQAKVNTPNSAQAPAPAPAVEEEPAEVEAKVNEAKLELGGGGDGPGGDDGDAPRSGGDPIQAKGGGDGAIPSAPRGGGAPAPAPNAPTPPPPAPSAPTPPAPTPPPAPAPTPSASAPAPAPPSSGSPLPEGLKGQMESAFNKDLSGITIREDSSATALGAQAYTQGNTITMAPGKLDPTSKSGKELIGHEIAHTEQQAAGRVQADSQAKDGQALNTDKALEAEADNAGAAAAAGRPAFVGGAGIGTQRKAADPIQRKARPVQRKSAGPIQLKKTGETETIEAETETPSAEQTQELADWKPVFGNSIEENYFEGERFSVKEQGGSTIQAYLVFRLTLGTYERKQPREDGTPYYSTIPTGAAYGVSKRIAPDLEKHFRALIETKGLAGAKQQAASAGFFWPTKESALPLYAEENAQLFEQVKIRLSAVAVDVDLDKNRVDNRKEYDEAWIAKHGQRSAETDKYWKKDGIAPPGVDEVEWKKQLEAEKAKAPAGEGEHEEAEQPNKNATSLNFITEMFKVDADKGREEGQEYNAIPKEIALSGHVHTISGNPAEKKGAGGENNIALLNQNKARRAVTSLLPGLVKKRIAKKGYAEAVSDKERKEVSEIAKIMAQYDAERFGLEIDMIDFEVLGDEKGATALKNALADGTAIGHEEPEVLIGLEKNKKGRLEGSITIPFINLGGGLIAKDLNGMVEWDPKTNMLYSFTGGATVIVPFGESHVFEIMCQGMKIVRGADITIKTKQGKIEIPTLMVEQGKGSFKVLTPIELFTTKTGYTASLAPGANGKVEIKKGEVKNIEGEIELEIEDPQKEKIFTLKLSGSYGLKENKAEAKSFNGAAEAHVLKDLEFARGFGPDQDWTAFVTKGTHAAATVAKGELKKIDGKIGARIDNKAKEPWLKIDAEGDYDHEERSGNVEGNVDVVKQTLVGRFGEGNEIHLGEGTLAKAKVAGNKLVSASGTLLALIRTAGKDTLKIKAKGSWAENQGLDGEGEATLLEDLVYPMGDGTVKVHNGASGKAVVKAGVLTSISGSAKVDLIGKFDEQPLDVGIEGSGTFDVVGKNVVKAHGSAKLNKPLKLGKHVLLEKVEGDLAVENNELVSAKGKIGAVFEDEKGPLVGGYVEGEWKRETNALDGSATVDLRRDITVQLGAGISATVKKSATKIGAKVVKNEITEVNGGLSVDLYRNAKLIANLSAKNAVYDVKNNVLRSLTATATLKDDFQLLDGKVTISKASATVTVAEGKLTSVKADASLEAPTLNIPAVNIAFTWRNDGTKDIYSFKGAVKKWALFKGKERSLVGDLALDYHEDGTFDAHALITYQMAKGFTATGDLSIDQTLIPKVNKLEFNFETTLSKKTDLFKFDTQIVKLFIQILVFRLSLGIDMGSSLSMLPITLAGKFGVENWSPGTDEANQVPNFNAQLNLGMGFDFEVWLAASLEASLDVLVAALGIGAKAKLILKVPIRIKPSLTLEGGPKGWSGAFGIDLSITPELALKLSAYLFADIVFFDPWEYVLGEWPFDLGKLPGLKWSDTFAFGENKDAKPKEKTPVQPPAGTVAKSGGGEKNTKKASELKPPVAPPGNQKAESAELPGGVPISGDSLLGKQKEGAGNKDKEGKEETDNQLADIMEAAQGLQAIDTFIKFVKECAAYILNSGPILGVLMLAWDVFTGKINLDKLKVAWGEFKRGIKAAGRLLKGMSDNQFGFTYRMGRWMNGEISAWDLIMEGDNEIVTFVNQGKHKEKGFDPKNYNSMLQVLCGWDNACGPTEQACVIEIMREAGKRGFLHRSLIGLKGSMYVDADQVLWKCEGIYDEQARQIFTQYGVVPGQELLNAAKEKYGPVYFGVRQMLPSWQDRLTADAIYDQAGKAAAMKWVNTKLGK